MRWNKRWMDYGKCWFYKSIINKKKKKSLDSKNGIKELKVHTWLKYYPWKELSQKTLPAPFIPEKIDNFDKKYCENIDEISEETQIRYEKIMLWTNFNTAFSDIYFNKKEMKRNEDIKDESNENESSEEENSSNSNANENNIIKEIIHDKEYEKNIIKDNKKKMK